MGQSKHEQLLAQRAMLFDKITDLPNGASTFRNALLALWYPCFDLEAIDLALRQLSTLNYLKDAE